MQSVYIPSWAFTVHLQGRDLSKTASCTCCSCHQIILVILSQTNLFQFGSVFLVIGSPKLDTVLQMQFHNTQQKGIAFFDRLSTCFLMQCGILLAFLAMGLLCWLMFYFLPTRISRSLSGNLLSSQLAMPRLYWSMGLFHPKYKTLQILSNFRRFGCKDIMAGCENIAKVKVIYIHGSPLTHAARHLTSEDHQAAKAALVNTCCLFPISFFM